MMCSDLKLASTNNRWSLGWDWKAGCNAKDEPISNWYQTSKDTGTKVVTREGAAPQQVSLCNQADCRVELVGTSLGAKPEVSLGISSDADGYGAQG
eukprot:3356687-Amphidinium_carterae.1